MFAAALLLFLPTLGHDFVWDDRSILMPNRALGDWSRLAENLTSNFFRESQEPGAFDYWRPLVVLSHMVERSLFGDGAAGHHATNVLLHAVTSLLVFLLGLRALNRLAAAFAAGLVFAVHPVHVEVVAWVSGRSDLLVGLFLALALWADWRWAQDGRRAWQVAALAAFAAALLSKESAAVFPALVASRALLLGAQGRRPGERAAAALEAALPALLLLAAYLALRYGLLGVAPPEPGAAPAGRAALFWTWWSALWSYIRLLLWPADLSIVHDLALVSSPWSWRVAGGLAVLAAALWGTWSLRRTAPGAAFGLLVLLVGMAPLTHFLVPIASHREAVFPIAERFLYAPSIGLALLLGWLFAVAVPRALARIGAGGRAPAAALLGLAALAGAWASAVRAAEWRSDATLFAAAVRSSPGNPMARLNYGSALAELAREAATDEDRRALRSRALRHLEEAAVLAPENYRAHYDLGNLQLALGRPRAAESSFRQALRLNPGLFQAMVNLGALLAQSGRPVEALEWFEAAGRLRPENLAVMVNRAHALQALGRSPEAIPLYRRALAVDPGLVAARLGLERALGETTSPGSDGS